MIQPILCFRLIMPLPMLHRYDFPISDLNRE
jgi:hypothetical protein